MLTPAEAIFVRAQQVWAERAVPPYESFRIACAQTYLADRCAAGEVVEFTMRTADGRTFAQTVSTSTTPSRTLLRGGFITGPDATPLGFYRILPTTPGGFVQQPPPNLAPDPLLPTITVASAVSRSYAIAFAGVERLGPYSVDHLTLRPLSDGERHALRELWVDEASGNIVRLIYAHDFGNGRWGTVDYRFSPRGEREIWTIVHIEADAPAGSAFGPAPQHVQSDLDDIAFPAAMPDADFTPNPESSPESTDSRRSCGSDT